ncbi:MAG: hypothetical protein ACI9UN_003561 [Granulosicoccus sp.]|jgi:hypothetical protein
MYYPLLTAGAIHQCYNKASKRGYAIEDSSAPNTKNSHSQTSFGMSSFSAKERQQFGQNVRLAMACIESPVQPTKSMAMPSDEATIHNRLKVLSQDITSSHADCSRTTSPVQ